jgi:hypothetical protein
MAFQNASGSRFCHKVRSNPNIRMQLALQDAFAHVNILYSVELEFCNLYGIGYY